MGMIYLKLVVSMVIWGGTFVAAKIVLHSMGVFSGAFLRFAIASLALWLICVRSSDPTLRQALHLSRSQLGWVTLMGLTGVFAYNSFFFLGLQLIPAGRAALIVAQNPIAIALFATLLFGEPMSWLKAGGILTSFIGAAVVITQGEPLRIFSQGLGLGEIYLFCCLLSWVAYTLVSKQALTRISATVATTYACTIGAIALLVPALGEGLITRAPSFEPASWLAVTYGGVLGSAVTFIWYSEGIQKLGASRAGIFINLVPPSAVILAALILREPITPSLVIGGGLIIAGVILTNRQLP